MAETDDQAELFRHLAVWAPWLEFEVISVMDIADATPVQQNALEKGSAGPLWGTRPTGRMRRQAP